MMISIIQQSCLYLPLALGVFISYRLLRVPDLGSDASFVLSSAVFATLRTGGMTLQTSIALAILTGGFLGIVSSLIQNNLKLSPLLAGILLVFIMQPVTYKIMGKPNISLLGLPKIFEVNFKTEGLLIVAFLIAAQALVLLSSRFGVMLKATGNNSQLLHHLGKSAAFYKSAGLFISNSLVAVSGILCADSFGFADLGMGHGVILICLAIVILGSQFKKLLFSKSRFLNFQEIVCLSISSSFYFLIQNVFVSLSFDLIYLKLLTGCSLLIFIGLSNRSRFALEAT